LQLGLPGVWDYGADIWDILGAQILLLDDRDWLRRKVPSKGVKPLKQGLPEDALGVAHNKKLKGAWSTKSTRKSDFRTIR
jgi:hypothetical protein